MHYYYYYYWSGQVWKVFVTQSRDQCLTYGLGSIQKNQCSLTTPSVCLLGFE